MFRLSPIRPHPHQVELDLRGPVHTGSRPTPGTGSVVRNSVRKAQTLPKSSDGQMLDHPERWLIIGQLIGFTRLRIGF
jgi:hypothetical protein